jgi:NAD(P)-dependent dehydrogenase (short-subunit alcohol dehydrogenase family)
VASEITNGPAIGRATDMGDEEQIQGMITASIDAFGRIDGLVNNAADLSQNARDGNVVNTGLGVWDRAYQVNLRGAVAACKYTIPHMIEVGGGSIVNVSSIQSLLGDMERIAYSAMKSAMNSLTRSVATAFGKQGVRCNTVCPGPVMSREPGREWPATLLQDFRNNILLNDVSRPEELAELIIFLLSDAASAVTAQTIAADAGFASHMHFHMKLMRDN